MNANDFSIARDRTRRTNVSSVHARQSNPSGHQDPSTTENPGQRDPPRDLSGQQFNDSHPHDVQDGVDNFNFGDPRFPSIPQNSQDAMDSLTEEDVLCRARSSGQPELPRCVTSRSSGVTSESSSGCVTSTGTLSLGHSRTDPTSSSLLSVSSPILDMNSYKKRYTAIDPEYLPALQPLDTSLRSRFEDAVSTTTSSGDPPPAALAVLKTYGLSPLTAVGNWSPDVQTYTDLIDNLLAIRSGETALPSLTPEVQRHLYLMGGIQVRDLEIVTLAQCARLFMEKWGRSFADVATCFGRPNPVMAELKAILGIMGYPFSASASKPDLRDAVLLAQKLAVYQGLLIPQILQPYTEVTLPGRAALDNASDEFLGCLIAALMDPSLPDPFYRPGTTAYGTF